MDILITDNQFAELVIELLEEMSGPFKWFNFKTISGNDVRALHSTVNNTTLLAIIEATNEDKYLVSASILNDIKKYFNVSNDELFDSGVLHKVFKHYTGIYPIELSLTNKNQ
jgi:hypothetical protein